MPQYALAILHSRNNLSREAIGALRMEKTMGSTFSDQIAAIENRLTLNEIPLDRGKIWDFFLTQWRQDKRNVFVNRIPGYSEVKARFQDDRVKWVPDFWRMWNLGLSGTVTDEQAVAHTRACLSLATSLINHPQYGNPEWAITFRQLISNLYRPERVCSVETARIFTWLLHNATRRGLKARPLDVVSREWGWPTISANRLAELVRHIGGVVDSNLDPVFVP